MSNSWVVGDYKLNDKIYRNIVMKRVPSRKRCGIQFYDYLVPNSHGAGHKKVKPTKLSKVFNTQADARERKKKLEGKA